MSKLMLSDSSPQLVKPPASEPMLEIDNAANVTRFLQAVQPLRGCDYSIDRRLRHGDQLIREFAAARLLGKNSPRLSPKDAADVLYLMHNIEPCEGESIFDGDKTHCGYVQILTWVEISLLGKRNGTANA